MATLFVDKIDPQSGTSLTIGSSGDTVALTSGVVQSNLNYPGFEAYLGSDQTVTSGTTTKITMDTETFDSAGAYDNSTNYRFTPQTAGKYYVYATTRGSTSASSLDLEMTAIYKNGSTYIENQIDFRNNDASLAGITVVAIVDMNGSSDYLECYGRSLGGTTIKASPTRSSIFGAYRIGT
jgi:hypothetical protein